MIKFLTTVIISLGCIVALTGQSINTLYFMERIPQSTNLNPATQPKSNVYVGFPFAGSTQFIFGNNSLSINSILQKGKQDSLILFLHPDADKNLFFNDLKSKNNFFFDFNYELLSFGFRVQDDWYFNFNTSLRGDLTASYPKDLANLLINGLDLGDRYDFKNFGLYSTMFLELGLGASRKIDEDWTVGAKFKLLNGIYNISSDNKTFTISSVEEDNTFKLKVNSDMRLNTYLPMMEPTSDSATVDEIFNFRDDPENAIKPFESMGMAFDLGVTYKGFEQFVLSASIIDLGYISWKGNVNNYNMEIDNYQYTAPEIDLDNFEFNTDAITDSITNSFSTNKTSEAYTTGLPVKLYLAGEYYPIKFFSVGALSLTQYYRQQFAQQVMVSANLRPLEMLMFSLSYSLFDNGFSNFGFGTSLRLGTTQFYLVSDNIPFRFSGGGIPLPYKAKNFGIRFGFNFVFGCSNKGKEKDKPLNYE